ncbi:tRNA (adenine(22)-N(1))-methyltransferase TrmK [Lottiidibacillus patelloidae]|uniref:tRNA (Adenine(22)-N(1))-methyltransferase TrmK n=1 Tax=Lottiidibacillus patelloidae TaxID=2670334 RepID=A0A263BWN1_9BACI|nr:tRNA (adenine(22)-N(1))-methyltransferase TrmK [Lottiidibacillus patelloidae]OZM57727.1 tRNA (adenine(22)-N(1))-methyltransferase TrmK [Lottiidibacillus patelloidae]
MNEKELSNRLKQVVNYIPKGSRIADIGSDHAYLPCYAYLQGIASFAIAGEVNEGPFQSAQEQVNKLNLQDVISVRKGNGLEVINNGEVDAITIAGMGGPLIASILEEGKDKLDSVKRLILQPNVAAIFIRKWLEENNWRLVAEDILEEDGKIYEILTAEQGQDLELYKENREAKLLLGPFLMQEKKDTFIKKWNQELKKYENVAKQIKQAQSGTEVETKYEDVRNKIDMIKEVIKE